MIKDSSVSRKVLLINPSFQFRFMAWMGGLAVAVIMVFHLSHLWFFYQLRDQAKLAGLPADHTLFQFISDRQSEMDSILFMTFAVVIVLVATIGLVLSHKIAGPMYRLRKHFEACARDGKIKEFNFRQGDYFQEVPEAYNLQCSVACENTNHKKAS